MEFIKEDLDVDRLGLVRSSFGIFTSLIADCASYVVEGCRSGVDLHARSENSSRGSQRSMFPNPMITILHTAYPP